MSDLPLLGLLLLMVSTRAVAQGFRPMHRHRFAPAGLSPDLRELRLTACQPRERTLSPERAHPSQGSSPPPPPPV